MKKEILDLLALGADDKTLKLNDAFELQARYTDQYGVNVALSKKEPVQAHISLVYRLAHDKLLGTSTPIESRDYDGIISEVSEKMAAMYAEFGRELSRHFCAGYLG
jgi:hypothetical protein